MPVIRISDANMERLKTWAEPLKDTAESALSKALDAAEAARNHSGPNTVVKTTRVVRPSREMSERGMAHVEWSMSKSPHPFIEHLLAMPDVGDDVDFDRDRSGPRQIDL